jgi:hypothetical protein
LLLHVLALLALVCEQQLFFLPKSILQPRSVRKVCLVQPRLV